VKRYALLLVLPLGLWLSLNFSSAKKTGEPHPVSVKPDTTAPRDSTVKISLLSVGDLMCHQSQLDASRLADGTYNFDSSFVHVAPVIQSVDVAVANLETTISGKELGFTGYPNFNTPVEYVAAVKRAGFDVLGLSNNHSYDRGDVGIVRTLATIDSMGIPNTGTSASKTQRSAPCLVTVKGIRLAFLAYTYGINSKNLAMPKGSQMMVNYLDTNQIRADLDSLKKNKPDKIIALAHWGKEYALQPREREIKLAHWMMEQGVDIIFGSHPHVIQTSEHYNRIRGTDTTRCFVMYSQGNFISSQRPKPREIGMMCLVDIEKDSLGAVRVLPARFLLTHVWQSSEKNPSKFRVLNIRAALAGSEKNTAMYPPAVVARMKEALTETTPRLLADSLFKETP
jgi:poly-gamma-glutamate capsule biosynthesis protein CapA/YwtB (metallophosphatase superfamily)